MSTLLTRTHSGWIYPGPGPCSESAARRGWEFCQCAAASGGGHPAWRCQACDEVRVLGCLGRVEVPNEYGGRSGTPKVTG